MNTSFIHPPGSFSSQSTASLKHMLMQSTQLAQSWTTECLQAVLHVEIPFGGKPNGGFNNTGLIGRRWFIVCTYDNRSGRLCFMTSMSMSRHVCHRSCGNKKSTVNDRYVPGISIQ